MLDPKQRSNSLEEAFRAFGVALQAKIWTCLPGVIESYDPVKMTATVQPTIQGITSDADGNPLALTLPLLLDCPVEFPRGGGLTMTFPIKKGDECKVTFSSRCIDGWWQNGGVQPPAEYRMHDLSDGFVSVGPSSQVNLVDNISTTEAQIRSDDGSTFIGVSPTDITLKTSGAQMVLSGSAMTITIGGTTFTFDSSGFSQNGGAVTHDGHNIGFDHKHTLVQVGTGISGPPQ